MPPQRTLSAVLALRTAVLAGLLFLYLVPAAAALPAGSAGFYGGGAVQDYLQFASLRVLPSGAFDARATLVTRCSPRFGDSLTESVSIRNRRLSSEGRYSATTAFRNDVEPGVAGVGGLRAEGTTTFSASVLGGGRAGVLGSGRARGAVRVQTTYSDPATGAEVSRCDTGRVRWQARRPLPDAGLGPARRPAAGIYRGATSRNQPFLMRVTGGGRAVRRAGVTVRTGCPSGVGLPLDVVAHRVRIRRGRFGAGDEFRRAYTYTDGTRVVERYSWEMRGRFARGGARGTFEMRGVVRRRSDGDVIGSCRTGEVDWRAVP